MKEQRITSVEKANAQGETLELLNAVESKLGFIPNLVKVMANTPPVLKAYLSLSELAGEGNFSAAFREKLALVIAEANGCDYCLSAHTAISKMHKIDDSAILAARQAHSHDAKEEAGLAFAKNLTLNRGVVDEDEFQDLLDAGYTQAEALEIVFHVVFNTLTNYVNHIADTKIDFPVAAKL
ncbi:alkyl hydroperoxide reductase AhpD [Fulvitalea axinellae]|uniref:Alkyl hydroperoxide reductase AhpD n=1 Tax=Fulvitalea axinellae TaxID=1182444 RepID=A0AAU9CTY0_9BACT|nr:alkyl hydroperoxide reductase AhpD [Fulvitalea axinellae]